MIDFGHNVVSDCARDSLKAQKKRIFV